MDKYFSIIKESYLFKPLDTEVYNKLLSASSVRHVKNNDAIVSQGQSAEHFFLVLNGQLKLHLISSDGKEKIINFVEPGETFAEALMFMKKKFYPINATATTKSDILLIPNKIYYQLLSENTELCMKMLGSISLKMRRHVNEIEMLTILDSAQRVMKFFYDLMPYNINDGGYYPVNTSKKLIASKLSMRPETFSRILKRFEEDRIFSFKSRLVQVFDRSKMADYQRVSL